MTRPERGVLPHGNASIEARFGGLLQRLLLDNGWHAHEPWTPLQRDLAKAVEDCGVRIEVTGPQRRSGRSQGAGLVYATVCAPSSNVGAVATYSSAGFQQLPEVPDLHRSV
ncbi:hypothetical protein [Diaminobutyricimonas sp. LJ205]|uniref:hypothetical protein n=1 Tax=Diaminobutyricimonas sp. LJ205 TaxID=2683590 RepID=UPI001E61E601|nr:hypothetical protein [Diaminobutyricimonas sp. LJ205]